MSVERNLFAFADEDSDSTAIKRLPTREEALALAVVTAMNGAPEHAQAWLGIADRLTPPAPDVIGQDAVIDKDGDVWVDRDGGYRSASDGGLLTLAYIEQEWGPVRHVRIIEVDAPAKTS